MESLQERSRIALSVLTILLAWLVVQTDAVVEAGLATSSEAAVEVLAFAENEEPDTSGADLDTVTTTTQPRYVTTVSQELAETSSDTVLALSEAQPGSAEARGKKTSPGKGQSNPQSKGKKSTTTTISSTAATSSSTSSTSAAPSPTTTTSGDTNTTQASTSSSTTVAVAPNPSDAPTNYSQNLAMIRAQTGRNTLLDGSPFRNTPQARLPIGDSSPLLGPRSEYLTAGINSGRSWPVENGGQFRVTCEFSHFA